MRSERTVAAFSSISFGVLILLSLFIMKCASVPTSPAQAKVEDLKKDPVIISLPEEQKKKVFSVLDQSMKDQVLSEEEVRRAERHLSVAKAVALMLGGASSVLLILFFFLLRLRR